MQIETPAKLVLFCCAVSLWGCSGGGSGGSNATSGPDAEGFADGHIFDLGGVTIEAVHLPGHTRGHSGFRISEDVFFLSDIDLTGFGPYYGDVWSDLDDFEESLRRVRDEEAAWYVTFHHKGVIEGRARFVEMVDSFAAVIDRRHGAMLDFLAEPRSLDEMVEHRFIYRPHVDLIFVDNVDVCQSALNPLFVISRWAGKYSPSNFGCRQLDAMPIELEFPTGATRNEDIPRSENSTENR